MIEPQTPRVAIVDYGLGNLFSVKHAFEHVGMPAVVTPCKSDILEADVVVLPGVGAFGNAMEALQRLDLISPLKEVAASGKVLFGICLGMQLLLTESQEFGVHRGLDLVPGSVLPLDPETTPAGGAKVPHIGWSRIFPWRADSVPDNGSGNNQRPWGGSPLEGITHGEFMYFIHSYYVKLQEPGLALSWSQYGGIEFCSSLQWGNVFGCQFHPERSGPAGLNVYRNLASIILEATGKKCQSG